MVHGRHLGFCSERDLENYVNSLIEEGPGPIMQSAFPSNQWDPLENQSCKFAWQLVEDLDDIEQGRQLEICTDDEMNEALTHVIMDFVDRMNSMSWRMTLSLARRLYVFLKEIMCLYGFHDDISTMAVRALFGSAKMLTSTARSA